MSRIISWFSCGAASAVATKMVLKKHPETIIAYTEVVEEHQDNKRFLNDCNGKLVRGVFGFECIQ